MGDVRRVVLKQVEMDCVLEPRKLLVGPTELRIVGRSCPVVGSEQAFKELQNKRRIHHQR